MKSVLVLDALQRSALAVTRSLGKHRVQVLTADAAGTALAGCSRYSEGYFSYPNPQLYPQAFANTIGALCTEQGTEIIIPMTELTTTLLLAHRSSLPENVILPFPDPATVDTLANKCSLIHLAETLRIPVPRTWYAKAPDTLPVALDELPYPLVLKPGKSWTEHKGQWMHTSVRFAETTSEAASILESDPSFRAGPFMLQETVPGAGRGVFALYDKGKPMAFFAHRRIREKPPRGGVSVLSESVAVDPVLLGHTRTLLDKAGWHGIAMVEFRVADDGTPWLMEVNTRFWGSLQLAVDAGVDFPWLLYQMACVEDVELVEDYRTEVRLRWLLGDLDSLYLTLRDRRFRIGEKITAIGRFLWPSPFRTRHEVNRWGDLRPFWWEVKRYLTDMRGE